MIDMEINDFNEVLNMGRCAFLCGNGFSINLDSSFSDIFGRLYEAHKILLYYSKFNVIGTNKIYTQRWINNYRNVITYSRYFSKERLYNIFEDGLIFAESIIKNPQVVSELKEKSFVTDLVFGRNELDTVKDIYETGKKKGICYVNIEHWSILIYIYFALEELNSTTYNMPPNNLFISMVQIGHTSGVHLMGKKPKYKVLEATYYNGFNTYYRMIFSIVIFNNGKAINLDKLDNVDRISISKLKEFLSRFNLLMTTNYDLLLEELTSNISIIHLHGKFVPNQIEYVGDQSFGLTYNINKYVSFSEILIGDYFINKTHRMVVNKLCGENIPNKRIEYAVSLTDPAIKEHNIDTIIIFGLNMENDEHILRNIMCGLFFAKIKYPKIIYCYFNKNDKVSFNKHLDDVITFGQELSDYAREIQIEYIDTRTILDVYFYNQTDKRYR